ncbi:MAG: hypothetical protein ACYDA0_11155 [Candidatus Dormibacteraceae bacterium]
MSVGLGPPQISPDGKWVWDGQQWGPIPSMEAAAPEASAPLWEQRPAQSGLGLYQYGAAGAVLLVLLLVVLNATSIISIPWPFTGGSPTVTMVHGSPKPLVSDYVQANRFLNLSLAPALVSLGNTLPPVHAACPATMSTGCHDAVIATNQQMLNVLSVIDQGGIPACIAVGMKALRNDLQDMSGGIGVALHGFQDNSADEVNTGIVHFAVVGQSLPSDAKAIDAEVPLCPQVIPS